jgi:hypothetical protein
LGDSTVAICLGTAELVIIAVYLLALEFDNSLVSEVFVIQSVDFLFQVGNLRGLSREAFK